MRFPDLEALLVILRHHRIHEMLDGVFFADEAQEEEPDAEGHQNYQGHAAYRIAEPFRIWFLAGRLKEGQIYPRRCRVSLRRWRPSWSAEQKKLAESSTRSKLRAM